jgi:hypothetical protein
MSEKIYACLLRLYPQNFRQAHGDDALQLFRDRLRDETGFFRRTRLWFDIFVDLAISLRHLYTTSQPELAEAFVHSAGAPRFFVLEEEPLRPAALSPAVSSASRRLVSSLFCSIGPTHFTAPVLKQPLPNSAPSTGKLLRQPNQRWTLPSR